MKISFDWLTSLVDVPWTPEQTAEKLAELGFPVAGIARTGVQASSVVAAKILTIDKHPNADRLRIAKVTDGKEERTIVCGAPNIAPGQIVPLALPGAEVAGGMIIVASKIRGVESGGMLCSERELGLSESHEGILQLPPSAPLGADIRGILGNSDSVLDVEVTPNRPDLLSHIGVAREIAAITGNALKAASAAARSSKNVFDIRIEAPGLCRRYIGQAVQGVKIGPSPEWMVRRLSACGQRSINNIVDITNYVLLEWGHPLHAFDIAKLSGKKIVVRNARVGEKIVALDGKTYALGASDLVIADAAAPVAIAGIMGGQLSGVTGGTADILLESAVFERTAIRQTSRRLDLKSESSIRFEKGTNAMTAERAAERALQLILELAGGTLGASNDVFPGKPAARSVEIRLKRLDTLIGKTYAAADVEKILGRLDLAPFATKDGWRCVIPAHRDDIVEEIDLIEEIARVDGYAVIPSAAGRASLGEIPSDQRAKDLNRIAELMKGFGFNETITSAFTENDLAEQFKAVGESVVRLANPISQEEAVLRPTISANLLRAVKRNIHQQRSGAALFEVGRIFSMKAAKAPSSAVSESTVLSAIAYGDLVSKSWNAAHPAVDFYFVKGLLEALRSAFSSTLDFAYKIERAFLHPNEAFALQWRGKMAGWGGVLHPAVAASFDVKGPCVLFEVDVDALLVPSKKETFAPLAKFPFVERDIAIVVDSARRWSDIKAVVDKAGGDWLTSVFPFDIFSGGSLGAGKNGVAFRVRLQHPEQTLTEAEISRVVDSIKTSLQQNCGAQLR